MMRALPAFLALGIVIGCLSPAAQAGLFDDAEARQQITDLKTNSEQRIEALTKKALELETRMLALQDELARLRGQVETLTYQQEQAQKREQDLYLDLDNRVRRIEGGLAVGGGAVAPASADASAAATPEEAAPQTESQAYEAALTLFRNGKYPEAVSAFERFGETWPDSEMAPNAMFWLGNAFYAQNKCKEAIEAQETVLSRWPESPRAADAMLAIADCHRDKGNVNSARKTLNELISRYGRSQAAVKAKERLTRLR